LIIELNHKLALVTGSNAGIGRGIALALAKSGMDVAIHYLKNKEQGEATASEIQALGRKSVAFQADLTNIKEIECLMAGIEAEFGRPIDILVNNAGHLVDRVLNLEMTEDHYDKVMGVNFKSCVFVTKAAAKGMTAAGGGTIVNVSSIAAHNGGGPGASLYAASKAAMIAYTKGLAKEVASSGIRVNAVSPGFIGQTSFHATFTPDSARQATMKTIPLEREGTPEDVANAVLFLVSDMAGYITGETIEVNGGMFMR
jgi:3-oxoacyl-[acyl-carrier protein] reductase